MASPQLVEEPESIHDNIENGRGTGSSSRPIARHREPRRGGSSYGGGVKATHLGDFDEGQPRVRQRHTPHRAMTAPTSRPKMSGPTISTNTLFGRRGSSTLKPPPLFTKKLLEPTKKLGVNPSVKASAMNVVKHSWLNVLLVFVPIAWAMHFSHQSSTVIFCTSFAAIVPLAGLLGFATEELAIRVGETFGGLLNATFGNAVELIVAILALVKGQLVVVHSSMLGSILSNCLLVLGMCFFAGGLRFHEQNYGLRAAQLNISLLGISVVAIVIPAAFGIISNMNSDNNAATLGTTDANVLRMSRGISIILLFLYFALLVFQLWTHAYLYAPPPPALYVEDADADAHADGPTAVTSNPDGPQPPAGGVFRLPSWGRSGSISSDETEEDEEEEPKLSAYAAVALLVGVTVITGFTAEFLVESITGLTESGNISTQFVALILLPLVGNAVEHMTAVTVATKGKLDLSMAVAVGSSIQISLFVIPLLVILGWIIGQPLSLQFDTFQTIILFLSIVVVNWAISDGFTNWLEGLILMCVYIIIAVVIWFYEGTE